MTYHWKKLDARQYGRRAGWYKCRVIPHPKTGDVRPPDHLVYVSMTDSKDEHWTLRRNVKTTLELFLMGINAEQEYKRLREMDPDW
jgi:hypothetical protein